MSSEAPKLFDDIVAGIYKVPLFSPDSGSADELIKQLDASQLSRLRSEFVKHSCPLTGEAKVRVEKSGSNWTIDDGATQYFIRNEKHTLRVYRRQKETLRETVADTIADVVDSKLKNEFPTQANEPGWALVRLFGRLSELIVDRLEQVPDKHFLSFLDHAGIDLLPPRPAEVDLGFDLELKPDAPYDSVLMPKDTRAATLATEARPEIVFETQEDLTVVANELQKCITFDPVNYADRTSLVTNVEARPFRVFEGAERRERVLYLAADRLLDFTDDASRLAATITLNFEIPSRTGWVSRQGEDKPSPRRPLFDIAYRFVNELDARRLSKELREEFQNHGEPLTTTAKVAVDETGKKWAISDTGANSSRHFIIRNENQALNVYPVEIEVRYWNGTGWQRIAELCAEDTTRGFSRSGKVEIKNRPLFRIDPSSLSGPDKAKQLSEALRALDKAELSEALRAQFMVEGEPLTLEAKVTVQKPGSTWSIDDAGMRYLVCNENPVLAVYNVPLMAKTTVGGPQISDGFLFSIDARPYIDLDPDPFKKELVDALDKAAQYHHVDLQAPLTLTVQPGDAKTPNWELKDCAGTTLNIVQEEMKFNVSLAQEPQTWIALALTGFDEPREFPAIASISAAKSVHITDQQTTGDKAFSAVPANDAFVPLTLTDEFFPLGQRPAQLDTFYLNSDEAFSKPGATVSIDVESLTGVDDDAQSNALDAVEVIWEYFSTNGWRRLGASKRSRYLFSVGPEFAPGYVDELDKGKVSTLGKEFEQNDYVFVSKKPKVEVIKPKSAWQIVDDTSIYVVRSQAETLKVYLRGKVARHEDDLPGFEDTTAAFTAPHLSETVKPHVCFKVPSGDTKQPGFKQTTVNDVTGYWIRARLVAGGYEVPPKIPSPGLFRRNFDPQPAKFFAPQVKRLQVHYRDYSDVTEVPAKEFRCLSVVDNMLRVHTSALKAGSDFHPFSAKAEGPAMYIGWERSFPAGKQIDLLLDVQEQALEVKSQLVWEYWSGRGWTTLPVVDKSQSLTRRGLVSFTAPPDLRLANADLRTAATDHRISTEFGRNAFWFRIRPGFPPVARAVASQTEDTFRVTLDASDSRAYDDQNITRYRWRRSSPETRQHVKVSLSQDDTSMAILAPLGDEWILELDPAVAKVKVVLENEAGGVNNDRPRNLIQSRVSSLGWPDDWKRLVLNSIRLNNVKALNTTTIVETIIGSSNGERNQTFMLPGKPVLPDVQIAVREPDRPPKEESQTLEQQLQETDTDAVALLPADSKDSSGQGQWVRWHRVDSYRDSSATSRHFVIDPIAGRVCFGDGKFGRIPPAGRNNIKALRYGTHNGFAGNVGPGVVTVLRNPKDALANIRSVTNPERSVGASDAETVQEVKQRGPEALKHRHQAITAGGFRWLAMESTSEIARAFAMPARNRQGQVEPGWVTVIIVPESPAGTPLPSLERTQDDPAVRPYPEPRLTRLVKEYLEQKAATSLFNNQGNPFSHIFVSGPEYVRIDVTAQIIAKKEPPFNANEVCERVKKRLTEFLHPVSGGSDRQNRAGWQFGRDVFLSEIYAEIEDVPGVDRVKSGELRGSIDNLRAYISQPQSSDKQRIMAVPAGSIISTFDYRLRMALADPPVMEMVNAQMGVPLFGFKERDRVELVNGHDVVILDGLEIETFHDDPDKELGKGSVTLRAQLGWPAGYALTGVMRECDGLRSPDGRLRLPLDEKWLTSIRGGLIILQPDIHGNVRIQVQRLRPKTDEICLWKEGLQEPVFVSTVREVRQPTDRVFVPEGHLVYPGKLTIAPAVK